jgi:DNA-binding MarR family transcriptional regulator
MNSRRDRPQSTHRFSHNGLDRVIHERARLGVLTSLLAHPRDLLFGNLKQLCGLTDGNLNRHLQVLQAAKLVETVEALEQNRRQTVCQMTTEGGKRYLNYLAVLEQVIQDAAGGAKPKRTARRRAAWRAPNY